MKDQSEQSKLWMDSEWSLSYIKRNKSINLLESNISLFSKIISKTNNIESIMEIGSNIGLNLDAINLINNRIKLDCIEISKDASDLLKGKKHVNSVYNSSILEFDVPDTMSYDLVFTKTVLIHIHPNYLIDVYNKIYKMSGRYVLFIEYYNPNPINVKYRGLEGFLFKRDFAREFMEIYNNSKLIDYGFVYHGDNNFPQDDVTWFLIEIEKAL